MADCREIIALSLPEKMPGEELVKRRRNRSQRLPLLALLGPGLLIAATGVGAGDLATASLVGSKLGLAVLWAVLLGAFLKFVLNEGLARWQLATGETLLEGVLLRVGPVAQVLFLAYLLIWSFAVGQALVSACGITAHALLPVFHRPETGKIVFGVVHSLVGLLLVYLGGYRLFSRVMSVCIGVMVVTAVITASLMRPEPWLVVQGLFVPGIPQDGLAWTVALMGGVGGTVTILCYGYWIREEGREGSESLALCRMDLVMGYVMTAVFGVAMVIIGSSVQVQGGGANLLVALGESLRASLGPWGRWLFLLGAWGAVFSSLLGVWQSVPYLFADIWQMMRTKTAKPVDVSSAPYRWYLLALAVIPLLGLVASFSTVQKVYAILGALFMPFLAVALLVLNGARQGHSLRNSPLTRAALVATVLLFLVFGALELWRRFS